MRQNTERNRNKTYVDPVGYRLDPGKLKLFNCIYVHLIDAAILYIRDSLDEIGVFIIITYDRKETVPSCEGTNLFVGWRFPPPRVCETPFRSHFNPSELDTIVKSLVAVRTEAKRSVFYRKFHPAAFIKYHLTVTKFHPDPRFSLLELTTFYWSKISWISRMSTNGNPIFLNKPGQNYRQNYSKSVWIRFCFVNRVNPLIRFPDLCSAVISVGQGTVSSCTFKALCPDLLRINRTN